ncbi:chorismate mutase/prephenate dehydratase [Cladophialophora carrionii]|uniref:prephenate dehydratase n=1 Tax=Cladophialophora carrionii TaxID=86049 RepID=A0A1C1D1S0_9EURO|nr:chorismate mutase/prephenate dehydratase [Cladophialophora carrionii]
MSQPGGSSSSNSSKTLHVAYLGPEASFSHQAAIEVFPPSTDQAVTLHPLPSFSAIFSAIQNLSGPGDGTGSEGQSPARPRSRREPEDSIHYDYALVPIENSTNGSVVQVLDLIAQCGPDAPALYPDLEVCAEYYLPVHHCLFVSPRASSSAEHALGNTTASAATSHDDGNLQLRRAIRTLYTHPQVWGQCARFLAKHFSPKDVERIDVGSTSAAAQLVARDAHSATSGGLNAAIASKLAGERHALVCLAENIEDEPGRNTTRFVVVRNRRARQARRSRNIDDDDDTTDTDTVNFETPKLVATEVRQSQKQRPRRYKSLITFTIPHTKPGALADALAVFKNCGFNLTSIDTRPSRKRNWQYVFFVECEDASTPAAGTEGEDKVMEMLDELSKFTESLRYLGRFVDRLPEQDGDGRDG